LFSRTENQAKDYRHFNIKTVEGPGFCFYGRSSVSPLQTRLLDENEPLPNLIIIDGGKGQLSSALKFRCVRVGVKSLSSGAKKS
jgi:excinuclease ABC subunit C